MDFESLARIRDRLRDSRREGLTLFVNEFMPVLLSEGYSLEDLLHALANWTFEQPGLDKKVLFHLEKAIDGIHSTN